MATATRRVGSRANVVRRTGATRGAAAKPPDRGAAGGKLAGKALRLAGVGSEAVMRATGRAWDEWLAVLDRAGAKAMPHKEIALLLSRKFRVPDWWSQMVTVGYEQARGLRAVNQRASGYAANASKTFGVDVDDLYAAWSEPRQRAKWLPGAPLVVRKATSGKSMRITWTVGGSNVDVNFFAVARGKSRVQVEHDKLASAAAAARQKAYWSEALGRLKGFLDAPS
jgi:hypothetical protein